MRNNRRQFYVVQFEELPYEGIDDYVCVPHTWVIVHRATDQKAVVAYPKQEDPFVTRNRVRRKDDYVDMWRFYMAVVKYESDTFNGAHYWIATRNNCGAIEEKDLRVKDAESTFSLDRKLRSIHQSPNSSKSMSIKRPAISKSIQFHEKRAKLDETAQSSMTADYYCCVQPGCSKNYYSIKMQDNQPMENGQKEETASASNDEQSTEQHNETLSWPLIVDNSAEDTTIDGEDCSQGYEQLYQTNSTTESVLFSITRAPTMTSPKLLTTTEKKLQPQITDVRNVVPVYDEHEQRINNGASTSHYPPNSLMSVHLYSHIDGARRLVPIGQPVTRQIRPMHIDKKLTTQNLGKQKQLVDQSTESNLRINQEVENSTGIDTENSSGDRPTSDENSTARSHQTDSKVVCNNGGHPFSNVTPEIQQAADDRTIEIKATRKPHNNLRRFVLPPQYDRHDTRWTLKYRVNTPGLVELMPQSGIYVGYGERKYCKQVSKDCKSLARRLLREVFNNDALSVCSSMTEIAQASNNVGCNVRPGLDEHAHTTLLNFVIKHGFQCGWDIDLQPILIKLHREIQRIRFRFGVMVKC